MRDDAGIAEELNAVRGGVKFDLPKHVEPTEDAVAFAFAQSYAGRFVFDHTERQWYLWKDDRWQRDGRHIVFHASREYCRAVRARFSDPPAGLAKINFISNVERAARADPKLAGDHTMWNRDPWLLGTPGGVVDLRTGILMEASPDLYISRYTTVTPTQPGTPAPLWESFLKEATGQAEDTQEFLQRLTGYFLTGDVSEEALAFFYGAGGNGKGCFVGAISSIMGEYAISMPIEVFTAGGKGNLEYYRAQMAGARLVTASETESQATWAESQIKEMTGNETPLSGRHPCGRPFLFSPTFKICLVGNFAPKLKSRSASMERRLRIVPFDHTPAKPDPTLKDRLRAEWPQILRWAIDGAVIWKKDHLGTAAKVIEATSNYMRDQDVFGRWIGERCILSSHLKLPSSILVADYNAWARAAGEEVVSGKAFAELVDRHPSLSRDRSKVARLVCGLGLKTEPVSPLRSEPPSDDLGEIPPAHDHG